MARAERRNADYFPFLCKEGNNTKYIEATYGNDGFAVWVKILRALTVNDYHYLDLSIKPKLMTFASACRVSEEVLLKIINDLAELEEIDKCLWYENQIVWSDKFIENIQDAYKNRKNKIIKKAEFIGLFEDLTGRKLTVNRVSYVRNTQTIEEKSKEDKTKEEQLPAHADLKKVPPEIVQKAMDLTDAICEYFAVKKIVTSTMYNSVCEFVSTLTHRNELDIAAMTLQKYMAYKARSQEQRHNVSSWIGTIEKHFQDGQWVMTDWDKKLKSINHVGTNGKGSASATSAAVIPRGKTFGDIRRRHSD